MIMIVLLSKFSFHECYFEKKSRLLPFIPFPCFCINRSATLEIVIKRQSNGIHDLSCLYDIFEKVVDIM